MSRRMGACPEMDAQLGLYGIPGFSKAPKRLDSRGVSRIYSKYILTLLYDGDRGGYVLPSSSSYPGRQMRESTRVSGKGV